MTAPTRLCSTAQNSPPVNATVPRNMKKVKRTIFLIMSTALLTGCTTVVSPQTKGPVNPNPNEDDRVFLLKQYAALSHELNNETITQSERERVLKEVDVVITLLKCCTGIESKQDGNKYIFTVYTGKNKKEIVEVEKIVEPKPERDGLKTAP